MSEEQSDESKECMFTVYILRDQNNHLHIGQTINEKNRLHEHFAKLTKSAKFIKDNGNFHLVYKETYFSRTEAMRREKQLKGWSRAKKEALINNDLTRLKLL